MRRWIWLPLLGLAGLMTFNVFAGSKKPAPAAKKDIIDQAVEDQRAALEFGSRQGKVKVVAYYPLNEGHKKIAATLRDIANAFPGKVHARFVNFQSEKGMQEWQAAGLNCGCVLVDGSDTHTITLKGRKYQVSFKRGMNVEWMPEELKQAVKQQVAKKYRKR